MKLTMWMLADWLQDYHPKIEIRSNLFAIEAVRLFSAEMEMNSKTLYIGRLRDFFQNSSDHVICTHNNDMIILQTTELEEVLNCVFGAIDFYNAWGTRMLEALSSGAMLQDLFNTSSEVMKRPMFLLDGGFHLLAYHRGFGEGVVDAVWDQMVVQENIPVDFLLRVNDIYPERFDHKGIFYFGTEFFPNPCYNQNFFVQNKWVGCVTVIMQEKTVSQGELDVFASFCEYLQRWFENHIQEQQAVVLDVLLQNVISDAGASQGDLQRQLLLCGWKETDELLFIKLDAPYQPFSINTFLCHTLNTKFSCLYAVNSELSICLLCNLSLCPSEKLKEQLTPWLLRSHYYGTAGRVFSMEASFYRHYKYVEYVSAFSKKVPGEIDEGSKNVMSYILYEMQQTVIPEICHPVLEKLSAYDAKHHTDFYQTLHVYLQNERSILKTAQAMGLHRNSLIYRLRRLQELTALDLDDAETRLYLLVSFEIRRPQSH